MITMPRMRTFNKKVRIHGASLPEILQELDRLRVLLRRGHTIGGRQVAPGPFINSILVWFLDLPKEEQARIFHYGRDRLEGLLAMDEAMEEWTKPKRPPLGEPDGLVKPSARGSDDRGGPPERRKRRG